MESEVPEEVWIVCLDLLRDFIKDKNALPFLFNGELQMEPLGNLKKLQEWLSTPKRGCYTP